MEAGAGTGGEVAGFGASVALAPEKDVLRLGSWTSLPVFHMKRDACSPPGEVGEVKVASPPGAAIFGASVALLPEKDVLRVGSWTSLPAGNIKRRSCHVGEDMVMAVGDYSVSGC